MFAASFKKSEWSLQEVAARRKVVAEAPGLPDVQLRLAMSYVEVYNQPWSQARRWVAEVCDLREHFLRCAFVFNPPDGSDEQPRYFAFGFAYQKPRLLALYALDRMRSPVVAHTVCNDGLCPSDIAWDFEFNIRLEFWFSCDDFEYMAEDRVCILTNLLFLPGARCVSHASTRSIRSFLDDLPAARQPAAAEGPPAGTCARRTSAQLELIREHPWVLSHIEDGQRFLKKHRTSVGDASDAVQDDVEVVEEEAEAVLPEDVYAEMEKAHKVSAVDHTGHFRVKPLGGLWTAMARGVVQDAWAGCCAGHQSADFCRRFGLQAAMRFDVGLYGSGGALTCARYWVCKLSYWFDLYLLAGSPQQYTFAEDDLAAFEEPEDFSRLVHEITAPKARVRFEALRALRPMPLTPRAG